MASLRPTSDLELILLGALIGNRKLLANVEPSDFGAQLAPVVEWMKASRSSPAQPADANRLEHYLRSEGCEVQGAVVDSIIRVVKVIRRYDRARKMADDAAAKFRMSGQWCASTEASVSASLEAFKESVSKL